MQDRRRGRLALQAGALPGSDAVRTIGHVVSGVVLEDDADLRELLGMAFESSGVDQVIAAASVQEMQALVPDPRNCAFAVLDINLGDRVPSGIDGARWLRRAGFSGRLLLITGHAGQYSDMPQICAELSAELVQKPAPFERIAALVQEPVR